MEPAIETFRKALNKSTIDEPAISVYSNVDGHIYRNADHIRRQLPKQVKQNMLASILINWLHINTIIKMLDDLERGSLRKTRNLLFPYIITACNSI